MDSPVNNQNQPKAETTLMDFLKSSKIWLGYLLRRWWIIALGGILGGVIGIWIATKDVPKYESRLTFALDDGGGDGGGVSSIAAQFGLSIGGSGKSFFSGDNILEIMKSQRILKTVLLSTDTIDGKNKRLIQHFLDFSNPKGTPSKGVGFPIETDKSKFTYIQDSILYLTATGFASTYIQAGKPDKKLDIYEVKVTSNNERFSKVFTDRVVQETINFYTQLRSKKALQTLDILEQRVSQMKSNLNSSITTRSTIPDDNMNPAYAKAQIPLQKQTANIQVYSGAYGEMFKNLELARFQYLKEIPLLQIIDAADYPMRKIKMGKMATGIKGGALLLLLTVFILMAVRFVVNMPKIEK